MKRKIHYNKRINIIAVTQIYQHKKIIIFYKIIYTITHALHQNNKVNHKFRKLNLLVIQIKIQKSIRPWNNKQIEIMRNY